MPAITTVVETVVSVFGNTAAMMITKSGLTRCSSMGRKGYQLCYELEMIRVHALDVYCVETRPAVSDSCKSTF
jgi:hypothetical protein